MSKKTTSVVRVISYLLIVFILVGGIGAIVYFTNGFTTDFTTFYVVIDDENVLVDTGGYFVSTDRPLDVQVKYTMGFTNDNLNGYSLDLRAKSGVRFDYYVDDYPYYFNGSFDWGKCFDIVYNESSFKITPKGDSLEALLQCIYPEQDVVVPDEELSNISGDLFLLTIYSYNKESSISIGFSFALQEILLDKTEILF